MSKQLPCRSFIMSMCALALVLSCAQPAPATTFISGVRSLNPGSQPYNILVAADLNKDGIGDALAANFNTTGYVRFMGLPGATNSTANEMTPNGSLVYGLLADDINGDGFPDLLIGSNTTTTLQLGSPSGDGSFGAAIEWPASASLSSPAMWASARMNGDNTRDVVISLGTELRILYTNAAGQVAGQESISLTTVLPAARIALGDVNGDGRCDIVVARGVVASTDGPAMQALLQNSPGIFTPAAVPDVPKQMGQTISISSLAVGDLENDGPQEIMATMFAGPDAVESGSGCRIYQWNASTQAIQNTQYFSVGNKARSGQLIDVNGDNYLDFVCINRFPRSYYPNESNVLFSLNDKSP